MDDEEKEDIFESYNKLLERDDDYETLYHLWRAMACDLMTLVQSYQPSNVYIIKWKCIESGVRVFRTTVLKAHSLEDALKAVELAYGRENGFSLYQFRFLLDEEKMLTE